MGYLTVTAGNISGRSPAFTTVSHPLCARGRQLAAGPFWDTWSLTRSGSLMRGERLPRRAQAGASCSGRSPSPPRNSDSSCDSTSARDKAFKKPWRTSPETSRTGHKNVAWDLGPPAEFQFPPGDLLPPPPNAEGGGCSSPKGSAVGFHPKGKQSFRHRMAGPDSLATAGQTRFSARRPHRTSNSGNPHRGLRSASSLSSGGGAMDVQDEDTSDDDWDGPGAGFPFRRHNPVVSEPASNPPEPLINPKNNSGLPRDHHARPSSASHHHPGSPPAPQRLANGIELWALKTGSARHVQTGGRQIWAGRREVFVILFGVSGDGGVSSLQNGGSSGEEGIYSLRAVKPGDDLPVDTIIAFEAQFDAERYAKQLKGTFRASSLSIPSVCSIPTTELLKFCAEAGYSARLEPTGSAHAPPDFNVGTTDWERSQRLRAGHFSVLPEEPDTQARGYMSLDSENSQDASEVESWSGGSSSSWEDSAEVRLPGIDRSLDYLSELDRAKLQLERILQQGGGEQQP
eukprot:CAMPEP_0177775102 /NCGR_PEP_ID=MMETSP0491_2-20121128/13902_1 /TAXON_ID=63592 /ORGANISM="Tetraselmis chuii, Strain PLY429" /LENGTH=513 /DNA_ID=CAMNT_0019293607 /DNA_START=131 /DNA_END=1672 /DNA_ORIENTATION=+